MLKTKDWLEIKHGNAPLLVSIPHAGVIISEGWDHLSPVGLLRNDTDWWVDRLYGFAPELDATVIHTALSRTMIDVNRDPSGQSLYPGQSTTELCPTTDFDGRPLYLEGEVPEANEIARRLEAYHRPYHDALSAEVERLRRIHGTIVLWDAHSIRSRIPRLFDSELPNLNFGTNDGASCSQRLIERLETIAATTSYTRVTNGRFKGGYITRHHGRPDEGVHAVQLELAQRTYMREAPDGLATDGPPDFFVDRPRPIRVFLKSLLEACIDFARTEKR